MFEKNFKDFEPEPRWNLRIMTQYIIFQELFFFFAAAAAITALTCASAAF